MLRSQSSLLNWLARRCRDFELRSQPGWRRQQRLALVLISKLHFSFNKLSRALRMDSFKHRLRLLRVTSQLRRQKRPPPMQIVRLEAW